MRRELLEEGDDEARWILPYADFITLLFAFFVMMYSVSVIHSGEFIEQAEISSDQLENVPAFEDDIADEFAPLLSLESEMSALLAQNINDQEISLHAAPNWLEVGINSNLLFETGQAEPNAEAIALLRVIATVLNRYQNAIRVEGFTDDQPISNDVFASNWDLSVMRASKVVQLLVSYGIAPQRLVAMGYGQFQPVKDNSTVSGRQANRRVVLMISDRAEVR